MAGAAAKRRSLSGVQRQQVQLVRDGFRLRVNDDVHIPRPKPPAMAKKAKRKSSRKLEAIHQHMTALGKYLLDALFSGGAMRHVDKISERALF